MNVPCGQVNLTRPESGDTTHLRIHHTLHQGGGNRCIDGVAATHEDTGAGFGRFRLGGYDHRRWFHPVGIRVGAAMEFSGCYRCAMFNSHVDLRPSAPKMIICSTDEYAVRVRTPADAHAVSALLEASCSEQMRGPYEHGPLAGAPPFITRSNPVLIASSAFYVAATPSGRVVGCGGWSHARPGDGDTQPGLAHIRHFGTHPHWVGKAVGRSIFTACVGTARAAGISRFECFSSLNAQGFCAALGFEVVRTIEVRFGRRISLPGVMMTCVV